MLSAAMARLLRENEPEFPEMAFLGQNFKMFGIFSKELLLWFAITTNNTVSFLSHESS